MNYFPPSNNVLVGVDVFMFPTALESGNGGFPCLFILCVHGFQIVFV